jgi:hypothetical protein
VLARAGRTGDHPVITIPHRETGEPLLEWSGDSLAGAGLPNAVLL